MTGMDRTRFDSITRGLATGTDRRGAVGALAGAFAVAMGIRAASASSEEIAAEGNRGPAKRCNRSSQCGRGLRCGDNGKCEYKGRNCGRTNDTCRKNGDCCGKRVCRRGRCERKDA
jgi:hypothetical protein